MSTEEKNKKVQEPDQVKTEKDMPGMSVFLYIIGIMMIMTCITLAATLSTVYMWGCLASLVFFIEGKKIALLWQILNR